MIRLVPRQVYVPFGRPALTEGPRCSQQCPHLFVVPVTGEALCCVAGGRLRVRTSRATGDLAFDRNEFCRTCERMFGEPEPGQVLAHELGRAEAEALRAVAEEWLNDRRTARVDGEPAS